MSQRATFGNGPSESSSTIRAIRVIRGGGSRNRGMPALVSGPSSDCLRRARKFTHLHTRAPSGTGVIFAGIHEPAILSTNSGARAVQTYIFNVRVRARARRVCRHRRANMILRIEYGPRAVCTADGSIRDITATSNKLPIPDSSPSIPSEYIAIISR